MVASRSSLTRWGAGLAARTLQAWSGGCSSLTGDGFKACRGILDYTHLNGVMSRLGTGVKQWALMRVGKAR